MNRPSIFREDRPVVLSTLVQKHPLGTLVTCTGASPTANLLPFTLVVEDEAPIALQAHLTKTNSQVSDLRTGCEALVIFQGPQSYISPSWYPTKKEHGRAVPTWNYVMVQAQGHPRIIEDEEWILAQLSALTDEQERGMPDPWGLQDAPSDFVSRQLKGIVGLEIPIDHIEGIWKTSQNQPARNRLGVVKMLRNADSGSEMATLIENNGAG